MNRLLRSASSRAETPSWSAATRIEVAVGAADHEHVVAGHPHVAAEHVVRHAEAGDVLMWRGPLAYGQAATDSTLVITRILRFARDRVCRARHRRLAPAPPPDLRPPRGIFVRFRPL